MSQWRNVGAWLKRVVEGYYQYHAVPGNLNMLCTIPRTALAVTGGMSYAAAVSGGSRIGIVCGLSSNRWIPRPRTLHPYPDTRFDARIQGRSRMR